MESALAQALLPLRRFADFYGRSTRTELIYFNLLTGLIGFAVALAGNLIGVDGLLASSLLALILLCPNAALAVRRLHDTGRSGWWLPLVLPWLGVSLWDEYLFYRAPFAFPPPMLDPFIEVPAVLCGFGLVILLLWKDEEEPNRYGPNPRDEAPGEVA